ncbi:hypothetical protein F2Q69_00038882 [Brassica cretica]|uniref:Uncharacterized protein n=1 Tax=Brassica cretica TaxID=69181 RepID=A0A8S9SC77_BRACR|nr:hypothetical protein F2Q69_00038882 [Brassica cretica]
MVDSSKTESDSHTCHRECPPSDHFQTSPHTGSIDSTTLDEMTEPVNPIPEERFRSAITLLIGELTAVKSNVCGPPQGKERVMAAIKIDNTSL